MKIRDICKFAFNNMFHSKSRTIITSIIVFIVGTLIMGVLVFATNFSVNLNQLQLKVMQNTETTTTITKRSYNEFGELNRELLTNENITTILNKCYGFSDVIHSLEIDSINNNFYYHKEMKKISSLEFQSYQTFFTTVNQYRAKILSFNFSCPFDIIEGRYWNSQDVNKNFVWVTQSFLKKEMEKGNYLDINDSIYLQQSVYIYNQKTLDYELYNYSNQYIIKGIIDNSDYENAFYDFMIDIDYANNNYNSIVLNSYGLITRYTSPNVDHSINKVYNRTDKLRKTLLSELKEVDKFYEVESSLINNMKMLRLIGIGVSGLGLIIGLIIIMLSVGSIGNTIIISADKNKKFFGLLKAIGLKKKDMINIIQVESGITIGFGIILSSLFILSIKENFVSIMSLVFKSFGYEMSFTQYDIIFKLPLYIPIFVVVAFLFLGLLFSRTSLNEIANMDAISIISEVS